MAPAPLKVYPAKASALVIARFRQDRPALKLDGALWPADSFTRSRLRDGSITLNEAAACKPEPVAATKPVPIAAPAPAAEVKPAAATAPKPAAAPSPAPAAAPTPEAVPKAAAVPTGQTAA